MRGYLPQNRSPPRRQAASVRPRRRRPKRRFRWCFILVPLLILFVMWVAKGIEPALSWDEAMDALGVRNRERWTQLATLGALVTAGVAILRVLRGPTKAE